MSRGLSQDFQTSVWCLSNECVLNVTACESGEDIKKEHGGPCSKYNCFLQQYVVNYVQYSTN